MKDQQEDKVRRILASSKPSAEESAPGNVITVAFGAGDGQVIGNNNVIRIIKAEKVTTRNVIDPNSGELTPHQKKRLSDLISGVVKVAGEAGRPTTHKSVWSRFYKHFDLTTYHSLPASRYEEAKTFLLMLYGRAKGGDL